ncbi:expressed unknown protein [Ectocarpus siliculosus]|uniref:Uncharacterized protein n=1 Tax=Ectocarpus siliculosus TaxID=2880 RepID=D8LC54_ECTSI|nr:expressed unknown protein [Ectocarpus siliculosus]|eukprot:CBN79237.1 expressed unknown protein [Ectocarpus siliculosus]
MAAAAAAAGGDKYGLSAGVGATASTAAAAGDEVLSAVGREEGLLEAVCELALASPLAPAGGGPTWSEYGLPADCQRSAMEVLAVLVARHPANQVALLDRTLDAFLSGNTEWCKSVLAGVAAKHASAARLEDASRSSSPPASTGNPSSVPRSNDHVSVANGTSKERDVGGVAVMSTVAKIGLLCVRASSAAAPQSSKPGETEANGGGGEDDPLAAALRLRLLRRVLQAGGADARAIAASVGLPTGAAAVRRGGERARESSEGESNGREEPSGVEGPIEEQQRGGGERGGGGGAGGASDGNGEGGSGRRVRCGPPLTPALEVAMRLLADGYKCAVTRQTGVLEAEGEERRSPPSDLTHYLISLGELVLTWLSLAPAEGVGPALSRRLLASGSSWTLLRTFGRAFRPDLARRDVPPGNGDHIEEGHDAAAASAADATSADGRRLSDDPSLSYLHAVVAMVVGSFVSSGSNLASRALAAGIERYVGLFEFCRILDSASDWIAFAWPATAMHTPTHPGGSMAGEMRVPSFWALAGDSTFSSRLVEIIQTAQMTMIDLIIKGGSESEATRRNTTDQGAEEGGPPSSLRDQGGGANTVDGGSREAFEALLRRQQARIEELERRLLAPGANADHVDPAFVAEGCEQQHPTLTI